MIRSMESQMNLPTYNYNGARVLVHLHELRLRSFVDTWIQAKKAGVALPRTDDPSYESMDTLLLHVLRAAGRYMAWMCRSLGLPEPDIGPPPEPGELAQDPHAYMNHVLEGWREPLKDVAEEAFYRPEHRSNWKVLYCIDAMLEHAVMHPIRHQFQLEQLMGRPGS